MSLQQKKASLFRCKTFVWQWQRSLVGPQQLLGLCAVASGLKVLSVLQPRHICSMFCLKHCQQSGAWVGLRINIFSTDILMLGCCQLGASFRAGGSSSAKEQLQS